MDRCQPLPFSSSELATASEFRKKLSDILPDDFNTDFFVCRWLRAYKGDEEAIRAKLSELSSHRRILGYDHSNINEFCDKFHLAQETFKLFGISQLKMDTFSDDVVVFVQKMEDCDIKELLRVIPLSNVLHCYFLLHECFQRAMHEHELQTGRPSAVVVVLDLQGLSLSDFFNPLSASSKLARLVVKIWSDYFSENMIRLFLLHPPGILSIMWKVAKHIVDAKTQSRIAFIPKLEEMFEYLDSAAIPEDWGGKRRDDSGYAPIPSSCVSRPMKITEADYFTPERFWKDIHNFPNVPKMVSVSLKGTTTFEVEKESNAGGKLVWMFTVNSDITFEIVGPDGSTVWPKIVLTSLKIPDIGHLDCLLAGKYRFRFTQLHSSWISSKLQYAVELRK